ncbi:MAG: hypothetical protein L0Y67_06695 [Gammaproteobacteria bacterium]|nr:hypothetical protein [Gammaproteobacteria bacterium]MCI0591273.1 hypothetical protein [Gammaproteobacteria bacterium]
MRTLLLTLTYVAMLQFIACSSDSNEQDKPSAVKDHAWKAQTDALEKAKAVEQTLMDSAAKERERIDQEGK